MVPRGKVATYGQVAAAAGFPGAARLTVRALRTQQSLPWHRVVAAGGRIALPGAEGQEQRLRLEIEGVTFRGAKVVMDRHAWTAAAVRRGVPRLRTVPAAPTVGRSAKERAGGPAPDQERRARARRARRGADRTGPRAVGGRAAAG